MKYLCLAFGNEVGWNGLSPAEQQETLTQDALIRERGDLVSAVRPQVASVQNWDKNLAVNNKSFMQRDLPLAGFAVIEAESRAEVIELVSNTPCARAQGVIEIRELWQVGNDVPSRQR